MVKLVNRAKVATATTGTGTITLGASKSGYQTYADAGVVDTDVVRYVIEDGADWEIGLGTYTASGTTLSRTVSESSNAGAALNLSGGAAVYITAISQDIQQPPSEGAFVDGDKTKLDDIEVGADVTDAASVEPLVDTHLNVGTATTGQVLSWDGADYDWVAATAFDDITVTGSITEGVYTLTGTTAALDPANGTIQTHTLTGATTYTDSLASGQSITLVIPGTANTVTWPTIKWLGGAAPTLDATNDNLFSLFKIGTTLYGSSLGVFS